MSVQPNATPQTSYVLFSAQIDLSTTESLIATLAQRVANGDEHVHLLMSTPGGSVREGLTLYNVLRSMPFKLTTHNVGSVNSIGNAVFLAGEERFTCPHSTFMFHGVGFDITQPTRLEEKLLRERLEALTADQTRIGSVIEERTRLNHDEVGELFLEATTKDAAYAVRAGIVDEIRDAEIPPGASIFSLVFQR